MTIKQKAQIEVKNVFETYEYLYTLNPTLDFSDMDESVLKKIQYILMKELTGYPKGYRNIPVALHDGDGHVSYQPPAFTEVPRAFSVEEFFDKRIEDYYDTLMEATQGNLKPFIVFYLECVNASLTKVLRQLQRYDKIKHTRELLGKDGEVFHRQLFNNALDASSSSIAENILSVS